MWAVVWLQSADNELAAAWLQADAATRQAITAASHVIDERMSQNPLTEGESRDENTRVTFEGPLVVRFQVEPAASVAVVVQVRVRRKPVK
jgi:hypothetical protein